MSDDDIVKSIQDVNPTPAVMMLTQTLMMLIRKSHIIESLRKPKELWSCSDFF